MNQMNFKEAAVLIREDLRLKTFPIAVKFLESKAELPEKARQPSVAMGKRIAICQGVTMARNYGWMIGLTKEDIICVPAAIVFGFSDSLDQPASLAKLFCEINFSSTDDLAQKETSTMSRFRNGEIEAIVLAPMEKASFDPDTVLI
jgi:uncharacterized protein (DUF169 family)